jgi:hypothetical protein
MSVVSVIIEGWRYSAKWEENFPGYVTQTTKMQDFVLTVLAFGSHTDRNDVFTGLGFTEWKKASFKKRNIGITQQILYSKYAHGTGYFGDLRRPQC